MVTFQSREQVQLEYLIELLAVSSKSAAGSLADAISHTCLTYVAVLRKR